jgi:4-aminobutyrate aminotransferase/(S)-3-amino-2-methylpropionate transaminase
LALRLEVCSEDGISPDRNLADRIFAEGLKGDLEIAGRKHGLVLDIGGYYKNVFTIAPSFTISREEMDLAIELLGQLFRRCLRKK